MLCWLCICGRIGRCLSVLPGAFCWYFFSFRLILLYFYLLFRSVKKFSFERKKLVFSRVDAHLTHLVPSLRSFLLLTRSSPVPYTNLVSSDATHTLLHDPNKTIFGLACLARQISGPTILSVCDALEMSGPVLLLTAASGIHLMKGVFLWPRKR